MVWFQVFILISLLASGASGVLGIYSFLHPQTPYYRTVGWLFMAFCWWNLCVLMETLSPPVLPDRLVWAQASYPAILSVPVLLAMLMYQYTHAHLRLSMGRTFLLFLLPLVSCLLLWYPPTTHLVWAHVSLAHTPYGWITKYDMGVWGWVEFVYAFALLLLGMLFLLRGFSVLPVRFRSQLVLLTLCLALFLAILIVYISVRDRLSGFDFTSSASVLCALLLFVAIFRLGFLRLVPMSRPVVMGHIRDGVVVTDTRGYVLEINAPGTHILGEAQSDELTRGSCSLFHWMPVLHELQPGEKQFVELDRSVYEVVVQNFETASGTIAGKVYVFHDVSDQKAQETRIMQVNEELRRSNDMKDTLFKVIAHDLRGPVSHMASMLGLLDEHPELRQDPQMFPALRQASTEVHAMLEHLLEWSNAQRSDYPLETLVQPLCPCLHRAVLSLEYLSSHKDVRISVDCPGEITACFDAPSVEIVFRNLLSNAIKFSYPDGVISIQAVMDEGWTRVFVRDHGMGMTEETLNKVRSKTPVSSTPGTSEEKGTGIGLHLCHSMMQRNHGHLEVCSALGKGTSVTVTLPASG